jgi:hypothetical protein
MELSNFFVDPVNSQGSSRDKKPRQYTMYDTFHSNYNQATALFKTVSQMLTISHVGFLKVLFEFCHNGLGLVLVEELYLG